MDSDVVTVTQGSATQDLMLRAAATVLAAVEVRASPRLNETRIAALDRRRTADNIVSVLSGDEIRSLPNANAAEAAARIPGVSTERDEGEGKFVQIRGTEPRLSNVAVDGVHIPGTEEGDRIPKLDDIPSDLLGAVQVSKTLTADMDADAIGGSINLITKTPEGAPRGYVAGQFGQSTLLSHRQGQGGFAYGGRFGPAGRLGLLIGGSADKNDRVINDVEPAWSVDASGRSFPVEWDQRDYAYYRTRYGVGGTVDYHFVGGGSVYLRGLWSLFNNWGTRYRWDVATADDSAAAATPNGGIGTGATFVREVQNRRPTEQLYGVTAGGTHPAGHWLLDYAANLGGTRKSVVGYRSTAFEWDGPGGNGVPLAYDASRRGAPMFHFLNAGDSSAAMASTNYDLTKFSISDGLTTGRDIGAALNAATRFQWGGHDAELRIGAKLRDETKAFTSHEGKFATDSTIPLSLVVGGFTDPSYYSAIARGFHLGPVPDAGAATGFENAHSAFFDDKTDVIGNDLASFSGSERILAGYAMQGVTLGRVHVNLGVRVEVTRAQYTGHVATTPADSAGNPTGPTTVSLVRGNQTYADVFPSMQLRIALSDAANVRLAVTRGIARPNYGDMAPHLSGEVCTGCQFQFGNLSAGNPDLKPQRAWNLDLLAERYLPGAGVISGGVFYKRISGFIYDREFVYQGPATQFGGYYGVEPANGGTGSLIGTETGYTQRFARLPGLLSGLGIDVNWTHVHSSAQLLADTASSAGTLGHPVARTVALPRQSPDIANLALTYERRRVVARAAWQFQGANITAYGDGTNTAAGDTYFASHSQIDASIIFSVSADASLQLQGLDLNNAVFGFFNGTPSTQYAIQREYYGRTFIMGMKYGF
jgi:TonB-dependent receptor